jgi:hypothetical protein
MSGLCGESITHFRKAFEGPAAWDFPEMRLKILGKKRSLSYPVLRIRIQWIWIRIQHFSLILIQIQDFYDRKLTKINTRKKYFFDQKLQFTYLQGSIKDAQSTGKPSALQREHPALQNMKFLNFFYLCGCFCRLGPDLYSESVSGFRNPDPNLLIWLNSDPIRIRNTALIWGPCVLK